MRGEKIWTQESKGALILGLALVAVASMLLVAPALAYLNGDVDQIQDRELCLSLRSGPNAN